jgi:hypothetical protein
MMNIQERENLKTYAHILDGKVVNVSLWADVPQDETLVEVPKGSSAGIDWDYMDGKFLDNRPQTEML